MDFTAILLVSALFVSIWFYLRKNGRKARIKTLVNQFPGAKSVPFFGTILPVLLLNKEERIPYLHFVTKTHGGVFRSWIGNSPVININDPQYVELILGGTTHISKGLIYKYIMEWLGDGLLTSTGEKWHRHRKLLTPTFHFKVLESFMPIFVDKSKLLVKNLEKEANGKSFNIFPYVTRCTLDIISETAMGIQLNAMSKTSNKYVDAIYGICDEIVHRFARPWLNWDFIYSKTTNGKKFAHYLSILHSTTYGLIAERRTAIRQKQNVHAATPSADDNFGLKKRKAFLDLLLDVSKDGAVLTDKQIREEVDTFLFEGHDTTTASICWTIFLLGLHPDVQEKAYEEVCRVLQDDKPLEFHELAELKYLEKVLKESLRLYPSVSNIGRVASEDIKIGDRIIPAGCSVTIQIYEIHRNEKYFPDPEKFDPERFSPENSKNRHPYSYVPFSAGPRNCIGQKFALTEEKVLMSYVLKNYKIKSTQTVENVKPVSELILRPSDGLYVTLEKRK